MIKEYIDEMDYYLGEMSANIHANGLDEAQESFNFVEVIFKEILEHPHVPKNILEIEGHIQKLSDAFKLFRAKSAQETASPQAQVELDVARAAVLMNISNVTELFKATNDRAAER